MPTVNGVTYQQMVDYVGRVTDPIEAHVTAHDTWHLQQISAEDRSRRANFRANLSIYVAIAAVAVSVVFGIWHH